MSKMNWDRVRSENLSRKPEPVFDPRHARNMQIVEKWHIETFGCKPGDISTGDAWRVLNQFAPTPPPFQGPKKPKQSSSAPRSPGSGFRQCVGITKHGVRCRGGAQRGYDLCGAHL